MATISLNVVDKQHARLLQHVADAWDLRQMIQASYVVSPDAIVRAGQDAIDQSEAAAHRALDERLREWLVLSRRITWWQSPEGYLSEVGVTEIDWSRMRLVDGAELRNRSEQILTEYSPMLIQFVARAEALVLPPFEGEL
ncbi:MAG TPA: hypothetical protein VHH34_01965 [Pseudonocardiaceae bacterium]|nr:hypothetical protein [Pseudonocardiaceae bacterium]